MKVELTAYNIAGEKLIVSETSELKPKIKLDYAYNITVIMQLNSGS